MTRSKYSGLALSSSLYSGTLLLLPHANARQAFPRVICAQVSASAGDQRGRDAGMGGEGEGVGGGKSTGARACASNVMSDSVDKLESYTELINSGGGGEAMRERLRICNGGGVREIHSLMHETEQAETHSLNEAGQLETHSLNFHAQAGEGSESTGKRDSGTSDAIHLCMEGGAQRGKDQNVEQDGCRKSWETECVRLLLETSRLAPYTPPGSETNAGDDSVDSRPTKLQ